HFYCFFITHKQKLRAYLQNPLPFTLIANLQINQDALEIVPDVHKRIEEMASSGLERVFSDVDTSLFREDVAVDHVLNLVRWSFDGYGNETLASLDGTNLMDVDWELYAEEFYEFLGVLRKILYKEVDHADSKST
ncbi:MAG: hypothetical protein GX971_03730, partial [Firmicutes bacterium]|nr:hypothetical protein [Bacillota bacterium]